jgi:hypothetical protein
VIGGKELDLHVLYVEATKRGGYEKVNNNLASKIKCYYSSKYESFQSVLIFGNKIHL